MKATAVKLTLFVVACLGFTVYLGFTIGNIRVGHVFGRDTYKLSATFDDVTGLLPNDNVKVAGVVVGKVNHIKVVDGRALVTFQVRKQTRVPSDTSAAIRWRNLLGQRYLYLYPGTASTVLQPGAHITNTKSVVDLGELFNRLGPIVQAIDPSKVNTFLDAVTEALGGNEAKVSQALDDLATVTAGLASRDKAIASLVGNLDTVAGTVAARDTEIRTVLDNLVALTTTFSQNTTILDAAVTDLGDFTNNLDFVLSNNRTQVDRILTNLQTLATVVHDKLPAIDSALSALPLAAVRIFNAGSLGEWLNQTIPCGSFGRTADGHPISTTPCVPGTPNVAATSAPGAAGSAGTAAAPTGAAAPAVQGRDAITRLIVGAAP